MIFYTVIPSNTCSFTNFKIVCDNTDSWKRAQKTAKKALANSNIDSSCESSKEPDGLHSAQKQAKRPRIKSSLAEFPDYSETEADSKFLAIINTFVGKFFHNKLGLGPLVKKGRYM